MHNLTKLSLKKIIRSGYFFLLLTLSLQLTACNSDNRPRFIACGGTMNLICPIGTYCQRKENCGGIDNDGYCAPIPQNCILDEDLICGCDDKEYLNQCIANTLSVSVKNPGKCIKSPKIETDSDNE